MLKRLEIKVLWLIILLGGMWACQKPVSYAPDGDLVFSGDSIKFDTLFTTVQSPTRRLMFYNKASALQISEIYIEGGDNSAFELILDGVRGQAHKDFQIRGGDSAYAFVRMRKKVQVDSDITDRLIFKYGSRTTAIPLFARVLNAYLFGDTIIGKSTIFPTDKPIVVDGGVLIDSGATVTIPAGAKMYFSARKDKNYNFNSYIAVNQGSLKVQGVANNPVLFTNFRLDSVYQESPGQWQGLIFLKESYDNEIDYALIKNGSIGIRVDSLSLTPSPKVRINQTTIRNMSNYGILGLGNYNNITGPPAFIATNTLVHDCGQCAVAVAIGGSYALVNCTLANYGTFGLRRSAPSFAATNYYETESGAVQVFPLQVYLENCIIWGNLEDEVGIRDLKAGQPASFQFKNCLMRSKLKADAFATGVFEQIFSNCLFNQDPKFKDSFKRDYRLTSGSPAIDSGNSVPLLYDLAGKNRPIGNGYDIGAYEFEP